MTRTMRVVAFATLGIAAVAGGGTFLALRGDNARTPAERDAREACTHARAFSDIVRSNGSSTDALREIGTAATLGERAARRDPRWLPLSGGLQTLKLSFERDDAGAANIGIGVVLAECKMDR